MGRYRISGGSKASEKRKRKAEDVERSSVKAENYKFLQTDIAEVPKICKSDSLNPFQTKKSKVERKKETKTGPLSARDIWEGEVKVKPQKRININIIIDGKMMEEKTEKTCSSVESITGKTKEEIKKRSNGGEENERVSPVWKKATFRDNVGQTNEDGEGKAVASWSFAVETADKQKTERNELWEECGEEKPSDESIKGRQGEGGRPRNDRGSQGSGKLLEDKEKEHGQQNRVSPWELNAKMGSMEGLKWRSEEEEDMRSKSSSKRNESQHDRPKTTEVDESGHEDHQERKTMVKTLTEFSWDRAASRKDQLVLMKVPHSKEEMDEVDFGVQTDAPTACVPSLPMSVTAEVETVNIQQENREKETDSVSSHRSGKDRAGEGERMIEMERQTDKEKQENERLGERWRESKTTKERTGKEEEGRREGKYTCLPYLYVNSRDMERRDRQLWDDLGSNKSSCSPGGKESCCSDWESSTVREWPDQNEQQAHRDMFQEQEIKNKHHSHCYQCPQDSPGNCPHQHRFPWTRHSSPSFSQSKVREGDLFSGFSGGWKFSKPIMSRPGQVLMQDCKKVNKLKEWNQKQVDEVMMDKCEKGEGDRQDAQTELEVWRELEEGERSSSSSSSKSTDSSSSSESSSDNSRKEGKTKPKKKKRHAVPELPEGGEQKKHKMSKKNSDGGVDWSRREVDDKRKEEEDDILE